jgi:hypothetical protein
VRTTATLDPEVEVLLRRVMKERGISFKKALNEAVKAGLAPTRGTAKPFVQKTYSLGATQNFRWEKALAIADAIEDEELLRKLNRSK